jgi:hypothetical protein
MDIQRGHSKEIILLNTNGVDVRADWKRRGFLWMAQFSCAPCKQPGRVFLSPLEGYQNKFEEEYFNTLWLLLYFAS